MKHSLIIFIFTFSSVLITSCKKESDKTISGTLEYNTNGNYEFVIDAKNITATITLIAGGGGGGGGVDYNGNVGSPRSTGGGGGGGAGESLEFKNISLQTDSTYSVVVGHGGLYGTKGFPGLKGKHSTLSLTGNILYQSKGGSGGSSNSINQLTGGQGGFGYPNGEGGTAGSLTENNKADPGLGGTGGDNGSGYGKGGTGGFGTGIINTNNPVEAQDGIRGNNGYIRIEWTGTL